MDEATSALDLTVQDKCLTACQQAGIILISVAHRPSVLRYHDRILMVSPSTSPSMGGQLVDITSSSLNNLQLNGDERQSY
jgi:ABC-type uncharacterized transport system fused permease/ATPase subunit